MTQRLKMAQAVGMEPHERFMVEEGELGASKLRSMIQDFLWVAGREGAAVGLLAAQGIIMVSHVVDRRGVARRVTKVSTPKCEGTHRYAWPPHTNVDV
jgi:hypothetical protein